MIEWTKNLYFRKALAIVSFVGFALSLIVHLYSLFGINLVENKSYFFLFYVGIFIPFFFMIAAVQPEFKLYKLTVEDDFQKWFFAPMPKWIKYAAFVFSVYVALNFVFCMTLTSTVKAEILNGKYVLLPIKKEVSQQNVIREISSQEYELQNSYSTRLSSGHWMMFYLMPALFFLYKRGKPIWTASSIISK